MISGVEEERAKRLMAMGEMAASLAHEIRNPLGSMELFCSLLKKDLKENPELHHLAEQIHKGIKTLDRIIANCLQFTRDVKPQRKSLDDIRAFLKECLESIRPRLTAANVAIEIETVGDGEVNVDRYQIQQAVLNLVLNGLDAIEASGRPGRIVLRSEVKNGHWTLSISDNGVGIPTGDEEKIFDPFFTTKQSGTGLGLAVVHSIVNAHGGSVAVESRSNEGTTFTLDFDRTDS